jgi:predicted MPP superfamily phosphohydrolase
VHQRLAALAEKEVIPLSVHPRITRRQFLRGGLGLTAATALGLAGWSRYLEPRRLRLEAVQVEIPGLPPHLDGYTIGLLADLHLGKLVPVEWVYEAARRLAAQQPDIVLMAGDLVGLVDSPAEEQRLIGEALAPVKGAYAVKGNWDHFGFDLPPGVQRQTTVRFLVNEGISLADGLWLGGVDDATWGEPDIQAAMAGAPPGAVRILLAHEPDLADQVGPADQIALQLSGHSHGGQVRLPFVGPLFLPPLGRKYPAGLARAPHCQVYTSRGVGVTGAPIRFACPPEIALIQLHRAKEDPLEENMGRYKPL